MVFHFFLLFFYFETNEIWYHCCCFGLVSFVVVWLITIYQYSIVWLSIFFSHNFFWQFTREIFREKNLFSFSVFQFFFGFGWLSVNRFGWKSCLYVYDSNFQIEFSQYSCKTKKQNSCFSNDLANYCHDYLGPLNFFLNKIVLMARYQISKMFDLKKIDDHMCVNVYIFITYKSQTWLFDNQTKHMVKVHSFRIP